MKLAVGTAQPIIIGKRITIGAAINSMIAAVAYYYPEHAAAMVSIGVPITFILQVWIAHKWGITT